jgi:hypothetical protein
MMSHGVEHEELQAYLDRELAPGRMEEIRRHLTACAECAAVLRDLQQVSAKLQSWQVEPAPATLRPPAVENAIRNSSTPAIEPLPSAPWWRWRPLVYGLAATTAAAVLVAGLTVVRVLEESNEPMVAQRPTVTVNGGQRPTLPPVPPAKAEESAEAREKERKQMAGASSATQPGERRRGFEEGANTAADRAAEPAAAPDATDELAQRRAEDFRKSTAAEGRQESDSKSAVAAREAPAPAAPGVAGGFGTLAAQKRANAEEARRLIAYHVAMSVEVKEFAPARNKLLQAVEKSGGYVSEASTAETPGQPRRGDYTLRVPAEKLPATLAELRGLGRVLNEQLSTDEVTEQVVDLEARLRNARATEQRLIAVLNERTGKVRDILEVEREIARTRQEIERMEAQRQNLMHRVELATIQVSLIEEYKAPLAPAPVGTATRLRNAFVAGYEDFAGMFIGLAFFFARNGLTLLFWLVVLYALWRRLKRPLFRLVGSGLQA